MVTFRNNNGRRNNFRRNDRNFKSSLLTAAEKEVSRVASGRGRSNAKPTPMSVRNVEASVPYKIVERLKERSNDAE